MRGWSQGQDATETDTATAMAQGSKARGAGRSSAWHWEPRALHQSAGNRCLAQAGEVPQGVRAGHARAASP